VFQRPRGTRDILPEDMDKRKYVEEIFRRTFKSFGYREIQTPTFEHLELFTAKSGEGIIEEIYAFKDKSGRDLALRPELTAPVIRMYVEKMQMQPKPLKLFYFGSCFRYDRPQKGRYREFTQAGCELIGVNTPAALAELISLSWSCLRNIGLKNMVLKIGNLDILQAVLDKLGIGKEMQRTLLPLIDKREYGKIEEFLSSEALSHSDTERLIHFLKLDNIDEIESFVQELGLRKDSLSHLRKVISFLPMFDVNDFKISMEIVRGLEYYKGIVFEIEAPSLGAEKQICGGGSYELISLFGGKNVSTSGFAIGFDRVVLALEGEGFKFPSSKLKTYVIPVEEDVLSNAIQLTMKLRKRGIASDIDLTGRSLSKSMKYANSINAENAIIIGKKDLEEGKVTVRDMKTGEQRLVDVDKVIDTIV